MGVAGAKHSCRQSYSPLRQLWLAKDGVRAPRRRGCVYPSLTRQRRIMTRHVCSQDTSQVRRHFLPLPLSALDKLSSLSKSMDDLSLTGEQPARPACWRVETPIYPGSRNASVWRRLVLALQ